MAKFLITISLNNTFIGEDVAIHMFILVNLYILLSSYINVKSLFVENGNNCLPVYRC